MTVVHYKSDLHVMLTKRVAGFSQQRRRRRLEGEAPRNNRMVACIDDWTRATIENEARTRGISPFAMVGLIVELVAQDDLFKAVLDG